MKNNCIVCAQETKTYMISVLDILKLEPEVTPICYRCVDTYLDDHELDAVMIYAKGKGKWEGRDFFERAVIIDGSTKNLYAYAHRLRRSWKDLYSKSRVWYDSQQQDEVNTIVNKYLNASSGPITPAQVRKIHTMLSLPQCNSTKDTIYSIYKVSSLSELSRTQAMSVIEDLNKSVMKEVLYD